MTMKRGGATPPPTVETTDDFLKKLREGVDAVYEITCRGITVPVRVLSMAEMNQARRWAIAETTRIGGDAIDKDVEMQKAILRLASNVDGKIPYLTDKKLEALTTDEFNFLYDEYVTLVDRVNPAIETMDPEELKRIVEALKKNIISAKDCSLHQLRAICTAYVDLIQRQEQASSRPAKSSGGPRSE